MYDEDNSDRGSQDGEEGQLQGGQDQFPPDREGQHYGEFPPPPPQRGQRAPPHQYDGQYGQQDPPHQPPPQRGNLMDIDDNDEMQPQLRQPFQAQLYQPQAQFGHDQFPPLHYGQMPQFDDQDLFDGPLPTVHYQYEFPGTEADDTIDDCTFRFFT